MTVLSGREGLGLAAPQGERGTKPALDRETGWARSGSPPPCACIAFSSSDSDLGVVSKPQQQIVNLCIILACTWSRNWMGTLGQSAPVCLHHIHISESQLSHKSVKLYIIPAQIRVSGFRFRVSGFRVPDFGVQGSRFRVSGIGFRVSCFVFRGYAAE